MNSHAANREQRTTTERLGAQEFHGRNSFINIPQTDILKQVPAFHRNSENYELNNNRERSHIPLQEILSISLVKCIRITDISPHFFKIWIFPRL